MLTPLAAAALTFLSPQVIERQVAQSLTETDIMTVAPGIGQTFNADGIDIDAVLVFDLPDDEGVTHVATQVTTTIWAEAIIEAEALDVTGTRFSGSYFFGLAACSSACFWGIDYWGGSTGFGQANTVHPQGALVTLNPALAQEAAPYVFNYGSSNTASNWSDVVSDPSARAIAQLRGLQVETYSDAGAPTPFQLNSLVVSGGVQIAATNTLELAAAPLTEFCTSPPGSTGASATLDAYGSQQEDTEFLTIRAQGLPLGTFALLFVGTAPSNQPMGTTTLCVGGTVARMGGVVNAGAGMADFDIDLLGRTAGTRLYVQSFFRDATVGLAATNASSFIVKARL